MWQIILYVSASIALLALAALFIYLINFIRSGRGLIDNVTTAVRGLVDEIKALRSNLQGTIQNLEGVSGQVVGTVSRLNQSVDRVNQQLEEVGGIVGSVKQITSDASRITDDATDVIHGARNVVVSLLNLEQSIQTKVTEPVDEVLTVFSALGKGIRVFRRKLAGAPNPNGRSERYAPGSYPGQGLPATASRE